MNWTERLFLAFALLVGVGVLILTLSALGVPIPYLSSGRVADSGDETFWDDDLPPPIQAPEETYEGLLAELDRDPRARRLGDPEVVPGERDEALDPAGAAAPGGESLPGTGEVSPGVDGKKVRDPLVDQMKAAIDPKDPGAVLAFLAAMTTPKGTKLSEEDLEYLFAALEEHEDYGIRNLLMMHLERIGGDGVTSGVMEFLAGEKNPAAIQRALATLGRQKDDAAVAGLVSYMETAKNRRLREAAFQNLLRTKSGSATDALIDILDHSTDMGLKRYALAAASQLGGSEGADAVLRYASSSDPYERSIGLKSLRDINSKEAVPALSAAAVGGSNPYLRQQAMRALGRIRDPGAISSISNVATNDSNTSIRIEAIRALGSIGRATAIPTLESITASNSNAAVRKNAEKAIASIQKQEERRARQAARPKK